LDDPKVKRAIRLQEAYISERIVTYRRTFTFWYRNLKGAESRFGMRTNWERKLHHASIYH